ncbi:MAG: hypothetical protein ACI956_001279 [Nonlabens sp.]
MTAYVVYSMFIILRMVCFSWQRREEPYSFIDDLFPRIPIVALFITLASLGARLWVFCNKDIKDLFKITDQSFVIAFAVSIFLVLLTIMGMR